MRLKRGCPTRLQDFFQGYLKGCSWCPRHKYPKSIAKFNLSHQVLSHRRLTFWKNMTQNSHFSPSCRNWPICDRWDEYCLKRQKCEKRFNQAIDGFFRCQCWGWASWEVGGDVENIVLGTHWLIMMTIMMMMMMLLMVAIMTVLAMKTMILSFSDGQSRFVDSEANRDNHWRLEVQTALHQPLQIHWEWSNQPMQWQFEVKIII